MTISINIDDIQHGSNIETATYMGLPSMMITITLLLANAFTIVILDMDSALHVEYSDVVPCGAFVVINNYPMDGLQQ